MNPTPDERKAITPYMLVQIAPTFEGSIAGKMAYIEAVDTWGCRVRGISEEGTWPLAWQHFELTGGRLVWTATGERVTEPEKPLRHHP